MSNSDSKHRSVADIIASFDVQFEDHYDRANIRDQGIRERHGMVYQYIMPYWKRPLICEPLIEILNNFSLPHFYEPHNLFFPDYIFEMIPELEERYYPEHGAFINRWPKCKWSAEPFPETLDHIYGYLDLEESIDYTVNGIAGEFNDRYLVQSDYECDLRQIHGMRMHPHCLIFHIPEDEAQTNLRYHNYSEIINAEVRVIETLWSDNRYDWEINYRRSEPNYWDGGDHWASVDQDFGSSIAYEVLQECEAINWNQIATQKMNEFGIINNETYLESLGYEFSHEDSFSEICDPISGLAYNYNIYNYGLNHEWAEIVHNAHSLDNTYSPYGTLDLGINKDPVLSAQNYKIFTIESFIPSSAGYHTFMPVDLARSFWDSDIVMIPCICGDEFRLGWYYRHSCPLDSPLPKFI